MGDRTTWRGRDWRMEEDDEEVDGCCWQQSRPPSWKALCTTSSSISVPHPHPDSSSSPFSGFPPNILKMKTESKMRLLWLLVGFTLLIYTFLLGKRSYLFPLFFIYYFFPEDGICTPHVLATIPMFFSFGFLFRPFTTCFLKRGENK